MRTLARQSRVIIGVSGQFIGPDNKQITIVREQASLGAILDEICEKDNQFSWKRTPDGNIGVQVGRKRLPLLDLNVRRLSLHEANPLEAVGAISQLPEVKRWGRANRCQVMEVITIVQPMGGPRQTQESLSLEAKNEPVWKILNDLARGTEQHFWSAVQFSGHPCYINLQPE